MKKLALLIMLLWAATAYPQQTIDPRLLPGGVPQQMQVDGVNLPSQPTVNFQISSDIDPSNPSSGNIQWIIVPGAVTDAKIAAGGITTRSKLPSQIAYEDEANSFGGAVTIGGTGSFSIAGSTSGTITLGRQAAAGTYNFNLPTSAGTAGQPLISGGGGAAAMTFGTLGFAGGGTGATAWTASRCVRVNTAGTALEVAGADCGVTIVDQTGAYTWTGAQSWRDNNFSILGSADQTKVIKFEVDGLPTATTRTYTTPNANTNLLGGSDIGVTVQGMSGSGITLAGGVSLSGILRPAAISTSQNNYNPTGCDIAAIIYLTATTPVNITGLDCGRGAGRTMFVYNASASTITLVNNSGSSTAANRLAINANIPLGQNQGIVIQYDSDAGSLVWRAASGVSGAGGQTADNDLSAIAALSGTGFAVRTGTDTWALQPGARLDAANTYTTGDQSMAAASSFTPPNASGAAPTTLGRIAFDTGTTPGRLKYGANGTTFTIANLAEVQLLNANLTALANLSGINGKLPYFTGTGTMGLTTGLETPCIDTGGQHLNLISVAPLTFGCGVSSGAGISGQTAGSILKALTSTTVGPSIMTESAGVVTVAGGFVVGSGPSLVLNTSAITSTDKTWTVLNFDGTIRPSTGTLTPGNTVTTNANGLLIDGGAAGTGTWTDSYANAGATNKTLNPEASGNAITQVSVIQLDFASCSGGTAGLQWDDDATGDAQPTPACNDTGSNQRPTANFSGTATNSVVRTLRLPKGWTGNIDFKLRYVSTGSGGGNVRWQVSTLCRALGESWDASFNTAQTIVDAAAADNLLNDATQTSITTTGCAAEEDMTIKVARTGADGADTNQQLAKALYAWVTLRWVQQAQ